MEIAPLPNTRYDSYEPKKYNCIKIHDDHIEPIASQFETVNTYWHTLEGPEKGLEYYGITIIPPSSLTTFLTVLKQQSGDMLSPLISLINQAICNQKYIIHFGI